MHNHLFHYAETPSPQERQFSHTESDVISAIDVLSYADPSSPFDEIYQDYEAGIRTAKDTVNLAYTLAAQAHIGS